jgi:alanyl-tRNA synthetase
MSPNKFRQLYLDFFKQRDHVIVPSASLVPENDPTTLFTGSGMQPMIEYLLGQPHPQGRRIADSQKCFRSQDIEEVGDNRHTTFFEMLGNWSLGDYFKREQLAWFFQFLTEEVGLEPERLFVTVFKGSPKLGIGADDESVAIWQELFSQKGIEAKAVDDAETHGMQGGRIFYYDETKNWWSRAGAPEAMPPGEPGGPDSEVFFDFGADRKLHEQSPFADQPCHVNCDCGRFLEIGNSVFMQYQKNDDGSFRELSQKNVDFGGGLERILAAAVDTPDVFLTTAFTPIIQVLEQLSGKTYQQSEEIRRSFRVIADHVRAAVFLAADGVYPSNKEQGYYARRLVRRSIRYARMVDIPQGFITKLVNVVANMYAEAYPELLAKQTEIERVLQEEERKFDQALERGLRELDKLSTIDAITAFRLYETHGFPFELTQEIAAERGVELRLVEFDQARQDHAQKSRTASAGKFKGGLQDSSETATKYHTATHLLHAALRQVLGEHVQQKGSNITAERLRFDFLHPRALSEGEIAQVEQQVNDWIEADLPVTVETMSLEEALDSGALAFFGQRYPDQVTVYTIGDDPHSSWVSKELCGGPHVTNTGEIGQVKIIKEQAVGEGTRRIYAK